MNGNDSGVSDARDRLREKAQNEATCIALNDMLKDAQKEIVRLREENKRLKSNPTQSLSSWQPIATAPKDGTHVLLSYPGRITYGYWLVLEVGKLVGDCGGVCRCPEYDEAPDPFWYSEDGGFTEEHPPTHWMPLPEPAP